MVTGTCDFEADPLTGVPAIVFVGRDTRGVELTVVVLDLPMVFLVIHVQPSYRRSF